MKTILATLIIFVLITGLLAACGTRSADMVTLGEQDDGKSIELKAGDVLLISLQGNITTGFNWIPAPQDPAILEQVGDAEATPASDTLGSPGKIILQFKATTKGQTNLHLDYKRSWETDALPEKTFDVTVVVK